MFARARAKRTSLARSAPLWAVAVSSESPKNELTLWWEASAYMSVDCDREGAKTEGMGTGENAACGELVQARGGSLAKARLGEMYTLRTAASALVAPLPRSR
jgi:hypothetical protein